jgi:hypothetical protein
LDEEFNMYADALSPFFFGNLGTDECYHLILPARFLVHPAGNHALRSGPEAAAIQLAKRTSVKPLAKPAKEEHIRGWMAWPDCSALNPLLGFLGRLGIPCQLDKDWHYFPPDPAKNLSGISGVGPSPSFAISVGLGPNAVTHKILSLFFNPELEVQYTCAPTTSENNTTLHDEIRIAKKPPGGPRNNKALFDVKTEQNITSHCAIITRCPTEAGGRLFVCAGETANGTQLACNYFAHRWTYLAREMLDVQKPVGDEPNELGQFWVFHYREDSTKLDPQPVASKLDCELKSIKSDWTKGELKISTLEIRQK